MLHSLWCRTYNLFCSVLKGLPPNREEDIYSLTAEEVDFGTGVGVVTTTGAV